MFVSDKLKKCREEKGLSVEDLTFELDKVGLRITRQTLYNWEAGDTTPDANQISVIANFFNKPLEYFFNQKLYQVDKGN